MRDKHQKGVKTCTWSVRYTLPKDEAKSRGWALNGSYTCVCATIDEAIALVREQHPDAVVYNVNHKGSEATLFAPGVYTLAIAAALPTGSADK